MASGSCMILHNNFQRINKITSVIRMSVPKYNFYTRIGGKTGNFNKIGINSDTLIVLN